ncbi:HlyD family secretion protein [Crocinitomix algicola]|uniref:HlyD family secretion protein n=1 Tax=Crocinitomix algicola TaxID=1740263 RepID=UPI0008311237|nr:HlyD family efflux transporter periplasmic adaptor subunit [Crocinitomix algicola]
MPNNQGNIRSDEVQEIMSHVPHWMIRWGITVIFLLIALLIFISWFIKYPDVIQGGVTITTKVPPVKLVTKSSGEIKELYFEDNSEVKKGQIIAVIDDNFSRSSKNYLSEVIVNVESNLNKEMSDIQLSDDSLVFGSMQANYSELKKAVQDYQYFLAHDPTNFEIENIEEQIQNHTILRSVSYQQLNTAKKELENAQSKYESDKVLFDKQVISKVQLYEEEQKLIQAENNVGNYKKSAVQSSITITDLKKQLNALKNEKAKKREQFLQNINFSLSNLKNDLTTWGQNYQLIAPFDGKISYLTRVTKNEYVSQETSLFAVIPENQNYIGYIDVSKSGYGKIKKGQKVKVQIDNYPYHEFGQLIGEVSSIALLPDKDNYRVEFLLEKGMKSTYGKTFDYTPEMSGTADIITEDIRLLTRIFNKFRKAFD